MSTSCVQGADRDPALGPRGRGAGQRLGQYELMIPVVRELAYAHDLGGWRR